MRRRTATITTAATAAGVALFGGGLLAGGVLDADAPRGPVRPTAAEPRAVSLPGRPAERRASAPTGVSARTIKGELASRRKDGRRRPRKPEGRRAGPARARSHARSRKGGGRARAQRNSVSEPREPARTRRKAGRRKRPAARRPQGRQRTRAVAPPAAPAPEAPPVTATPPVSAPDEDRDRDRGRRGDHRGLHEHGPRPDFLWGQHRQRGHHRHRGWW